MMGMEADGLQLVRAVDMNPCIVQHTHLAQYSLTFYKLVQGTTQQQGECGLKMRPCPFLLREQIDKRPTGCLAGMVVAFGEPNYAPRATH
jgi:hypothetical protein